MCDPISLGVMAVGAVGTGLKAYGSIKAGQAKSQELVSQAAVYGVQKQIAQSNVNFLNSEADIVDISSSLAFAKAAQGESRLRKTEDLVEGQNRADAANRNLDPTTGSPMLIQMRNAMQFQSDIDTLRATGSMESADIKMRAANLRQQAVGEQGRVFTAAISGDSSILQAANVKTASYISAASEIMGGAAKIYQPGLFSGTKT